MGWQSPWFWAQMGCAFMCDYASQDWQIKLLRLILPGHPAWLHRMRNSSAWLQTNKRHNESKSKTIEQLRDVKIILLISLG
jgi:hypothetical protein